MKKQIPNILLYSRLLIAIIIFILVVLQFSHLNILVLVLMYIVILTDIFDGIIARKLNVSSKNFRVLDTIFDVIFLFSILSFILYIPF